MILSLLLSVFLTFLAFVGTHFIAFHFIRFREERMLRGILLIFLGCSVLFFPIFDKVRAMHIEGLLPPRVALIIYMAMVFTLVWWGYIQFFFTFQRSVSTRILVHIFDKEARRIQIEELRASYPFEGVILDRLTQMVGAKVLSVKQDPNFADPVYFQTSSGRRWGKVFSRCNRFLNLGRGG